MQKKGRKNERPLPDNINDSPSQSLSYQVDGLVAYQDFRCCQNDVRRKGGRKFFCSSTGWYGFKYEDIDYLYSNPSVENITLHGRIKSDCLHVRGAITNRVIGEDRVKIRQENSYNATGDYIGMKPKEVYNQHKPSSKKDGIVMKSRKVAQNISSEASDDKMRKYGLSKKRDSHTNLMVAAQYCITDDMKMRSEQVEKYGNDTVLVIGDKYTGLLREHGYRHYHGDRGTSLFKVVFMPARSVIVFTMVGENRRMVVHIDGSKTKVDWKTICKDGDCIQYWQLWLSASWLQKSPNENDKNKVL